MNNRKTKIVCSMGPTTENLDVVCDLLRSGMNVARFNFSHGTHESHQTVIDTFKKVRKESGQPGADRRYLLFLSGRGVQLLCGAAVHDSVPGQFQPV